MKTKVLSMLLVLVMVLSLVPAQAFAAAPSSPAADAKVTLTVSNKGVLAQDKEGAVMVNRPVTVTDLNSDGKLTYDEALVAAHKAYMAEADYAAPGGYVSKLWGVETSNTLFYVNDTPLPSGVGVDTIKESDRLYASVNADNTYYADWYTKFDLDSKTVFNNEDFTLNLTGHLGMAYMDEDKVFNPLAGIEIGIWENGAFKPLEGKKTDENGNVTLSFAAPGTYYVTARGTVAAKVQDWSQGGALVDANVPIMAPVSVITVDSTDAQHQLEKLDFWKSSRKSNTFCLEPAFTPEHRDYTLTVPDNAYGIYMWATLGAKASGEIEAVYTSTWDQKAKTVSVKSANQSGRQLAGAIDSESLEGNVITIKVNGKAAYTITVVREASLSELSIKDTANNIELPQISDNFNSGVYAYEALVPEDAELTVTAVPTTEGAKILLNGQAGTKVSPVWQDDVFHLTVRSESDAGRGYDYVITFKNMGSAVKNLEITHAPSKVNYAIGEIFDPTGMEITVTYKNGTTEKLTADDLTAGKFSFAPTGALLPKNSDITFTYKYATVKQAISVAPALEGKGTKENPYLIKTPADFDVVKNELAKNYDFSGAYLQLAGDITMPEDWVPIGTAEGAGAFSGNLDGAGHTLTFPEGSKPLFNYVHGATIENLNIYAPFMDGYAVVNNHKKSGGGFTAAFKNVTLKSGSIIKMGGFIGGYASGSDEINFTDCTVEKNVKIGCNKDGSSSNQDYVGSFSGRMNGTVKNCVSYADVYGKSRVGGIVGGDGQTMGTFLVENCRFYGNVVASGDMAGGIVGAGYSDPEWGVAPNAPCIDIINCIATGNVTGKDKVGGILGCELTLQCWDNGIGKIQGNRFTGKIQATGTAVGGILGYITGLDKYNEISGNKYMKDCGADKGVGFVKYIDTNSAAHETASGTNYFDTSKSIPKLPKEDIGSGWGNKIKENHNRTDDPLGADAHKLWSPDAEAAVVSKLEAAGSYKIQYEIGETLDLTGLTLTATWSDGKITHPALEDAAISSFDSSKAGEKAVTLTYEGASVQLKLTVKEPVPQHTHTYVWVVTKEATKTSVGEMTGTCACGDVQKKVIPTLNKDSDILVEADKDNSCSAKLDGKNISSKLTLTSQEAENLAAGKDLVVTLNVEDMTASVPTADQKAVEAAAGKQTVGMYLDVTLFKQVGSLEKAPVTETKGDVTVSIVVPESLRSAGRTFQVIRLHEGSASVLDCKYDAAAGTLSFQTSKFSTYALIYTDAPVEPDVPVKPDAPVEPDAPVKPDTPAATPDVPVTGDLAQPILLGTVCVMALAAVVVLILGKKYGFQK